MLPWIFVGDSSPTNYSVIPAQSETNQIWDLSDGVFPGTPLQEPSCCCHRFSFFSDSLLGDLGLTLIQWKNAFHICLFVWSLQAAEATNDPWSHSWACTCLQDWRCQWSFETQPWNFCLTSSSCSFGPVQRLVACWPKQAEQSEMCSPQFSDLVTIWCVFCLRLCFRCVSISQAMQQTCWDERAVGHKWLHNQVSEVKWVRGSGFRFHSTELQASKLFEQAMSALFPWMWVFLWLRLNFHFFMTKPKLFLGGDDNWALRTFLCTLEQEGFPLQFAVLWQRQTQFANGGLYFHGNEKNFINNQNYGLLLL